MFLVIPESVLIQIDNGVAGYFFFKTRSYNYNTKPAIKTKLYNKGFTSKIITTKLLQNYKNEN